MHLDENKSKTDYQAQISAAINAIADEYGFIGWRQVRFLQPQIDPIMAMAEKHIEKNDNEKCWGRLLALLKKNASLERIVADEAYLTADYS